MKRITWLEGRLWYFLAGLGLVGLALLLQPALLIRFSPDRALHPDTLLSISFLRIFLLVLGLIAAWWPNLAESRYRLWLIGLLLLVTLAARGYRLNSPYLDQHAHRQTLVGMVARNFYEKDPNILWPQVSLRGDAPNYISSTFPLVPWLTALGYRVVGEQPWVGRGLVALFTALGVVAMFGLVSLYWGQVAGFLAALFLALSPLGIFYGRALMDDVPSLSLAIAALWGIAAWARRAGDDTTRGHRWALILGVLALALAPLIKNVTFYIYLPVLVVLWERWRWQLWRQPLAWAILGLPLLPNLAWYAWAYYLGQHYLTFGIFGGPSSQEPVTYAAYSKWGTPGFVFRWAFIKRVGDRVLHQVMTSAGALLTALGLAIAAFRTLPGKLVFGAWLLVVVLFTAATGKAQWFHNYYQIPFIAALAPFIGLGLAALWERKALWRGAALALVLLLAAFSARMLPYFYNDWQSWIPPEAELVQAITAPEDRLITVTMEGETTLLYHLHRPGWVVDFTDPAALAAVPQHIAYGARLLILQDLEFRQAKVLWDQPWLQGLELIERTEHYAIYRLP